MAANDIAPIGVKFTVDTSGLKKAEQAISQTGDNIKGKFGGIGKGAGLALAAGITAATVGIAAKVSSAIGSSIDAASDYNESLSKTFAVFGEEGGQQLKEWADGASRAFGQSKQQALEAAGSYGNLLQSFGLTREQAMGMSVDMTELASDLASFNNTSVDDALNAIRSGLSGETEPLKKFGATLSEVRLKEMAEDMGLVAKGAKGPLSVATKAQAAYALILKDTALAQGDYARTQDGLANTQKDAAAQMADLRIEMGNELLPIQLELTNAFLDALPAIKDGIIPAIKDLAGQFKTNILPAMITLLPIAVSLFTLLAENIETVLAVVGAIGALSVAVKGFTLVQTALSIAMNATPFGLIITGVSLVVAGIAFLATQTTVFQDLWMGITQMFDGFSTWLGDLGNTLYDFGKNAWQMFVQGALDALLTLPNLVADVVGSIPGLEFLSDGLNAGIGAVRDTVSAATGTQNTGQSMGGGTVIQQYNVQARGLTVAEVAADARRRGNLMSPVLGGA